MRRYTQYSHELGRYVVPLLYHPETLSPVELMIKCGSSEEVNGIYINKTPDIVFGEVIDRLAELENRAERAERRREEKRRQQTK